MNIDYSKESLNRIKTAMMLLIVVYHSIALWLPEGWFGMYPDHKSTLLLNLAMWINFIHIYVFVFVSGYIFNYYGLEKGKYTSLKEILNKKTKRLILPYILTSMLWCIPFYYYFYHPSLDNIVRNYILGYEPNQLWFLLMLYFCFIFAHYISKLVNKMNWFLLFCLSIIIYILYYVIHAPLPFQIFVVFKFIPFFILGMNFKKYNMFFKNKKIWLLFLLFSLLFFRIYMILPSSNIFVKVIKVILEYFISMTGILFVMRLSIWAKDLTIWKTKLYKILEKNSMLIYLVHQQVIWVVIYYCNGNIPFILMIILSIISAIVISLIISVVINKLKTIKTKRVLKESD